MLDLPREILLTVVAHGVCLLWYHMEYCRYGGIEYQGIEYGVMEYVSTSTRYWSTK
jgi:hypothetical protein